MLNRKEKILISAMELLYEGGTNNVTTKNLAKKEGISEPALYRQYKNKHELKRAILLEYSAYDKKIFNTIEESGLKGMEALMFFMKRYSEYYAGYKEITPVLYSMDLYRYDEELNEIMKETTEERKVVLKRIVDECEIESDLGSEVLASIIHGIIMSQVQDWMMADYQFNLRERIIQAVSQFIGVKE